MTESKYVHIATLAILEVRMTDAEWAQKYNLEYTHERFWPKLWRILTLRPRPRTPEEMVALLRKKITAASKTASEAIARTMWNEIQADGHTFLWSPTGESDDNAKTQENQA